MKGKAKDDRKSEKTKGGGNGAVVPLTQIHPHRFRRWRGRRIISGRGHGRMLFVVISKIGRFVLTFFFLIRWLFKKFFWNRVKGGKTYRQ